MVDCSLPEQQYLLTSPEVTRIAFVRNPYTRLLSAYNNKVVGSKRYGDIQERLIARRGFFPGFFNAKMPTFKEFVNYVFKIPDEHRDIHWRSQVNILHFNQLEYNFIGYIGSFQEDLAKLIAVNFNDKIEVNGLITKVDNPSTGLAFDEAYLKQTLRKVYTSYKSDFKLFGYKQSTPNLK